MTLRKTVFWVHLVCGVISGIVVFIMSITGVALTYQKQMTAWADKKLYSIQRQATDANVSVERILKNYQQSRSASGPVSITVSADPAMPASIAIGRSEPTFANPYTGEILGPASNGMRRFFRVTTDLHRWLALSGESRGTGRAITGACNLAFLGLAITGLYLWWPAKWTLGIFRVIGWFRSGISGKSRDSNWHYVFGFWCLIPLIVIVMSGAVISYSWASNLVFQLAGSQPPKGGLRGPGGPGGKPGGDRNQPPMQIEGLDALLIKVQSQSDSWRTISLQTPTVADKTVTFTVDQGMGGQPRLQHSLTLDRLSGQSIRSQKFENMDRGLRARLWMRFAHTGEYYGFIGQTIAGIASVAGVILVWTGIALTFRRYAAWLRRS